MAVDSEAVRKATREFDAKLTGFVDQLSNLYGGATAETSSKSRDDCQSVLYIKVAGLLEQFAPPRLPAQVYYQRLVHSGEELQAARQYDLACYECFQRFLNTPASQRGMPNDSEAAQLECMALEFRANIGIIACRFVAAVEQDHELRKSSTAEEVLCQLEALRDLVEVIVQPNESYSYKYVPIQNHHVISSLYTRVFVCLRLCVCLCMCACVSSCVYWVNE
jgi:hypothetical protein